MTSPLGPVPYISSSGGPQITVDTFLQNPTMIPARVISILDQAFLADAILRTSTGVQGGAVVYEESTPIYGSAGGTIEYEEWAEIPAGTGLVGQPRIARVISRGLAVRVTERMRMRNQVDRVNRSITQITNTLVNAIDQAAMNLFFTASPAIVPSVAAASTWDGNHATATPLADILSAKKAVNLAKDTQGNEFGYHADTIVLNDAIENDLLLNADIKSLYQGNAAAASPLFKGQWDKTINGMTWLFSPRVPLTKALVLERKTCGFIADERSLRATELYYERREAETWRSDVTRWSAMGIDNPLSACVITGVHS